MSSSAKPEKKWTPQEDEILRAAVAQFGTKNSWQKISERLPGRSNKSCRKRWIHSLDPQLKKGRWTAAEDTKLKEAIKEHGLQWWKVARQIDGRTDDQCAKRWREKLDPSISRRPWSALEDQTLMDAWRIHGKKWNIISTMLPGRPAVHCRNRYQSLTRVSRRATTSATSGDSSTPVLLASSHGQDDGEDLNRKLSKYDSDSPMMGNRLLPGSSSINSPLDLNGRRPSWQSQGSNADPFLGFQRYPTDPSPSLPFDSPRSSSGLEMSPASHASSSPASSEELQLPSTLGLEYDARMGLHQRNYEESRYKDSSMGIGTYGNDHYPEAIPPIASLPHPSFDGSLLSGPGQDHRRMSFAGMSYPPLLSDTSRGTQAGDNVDVLLQGLSSRWGAEKAVAMSHPSQRLGSFSHLPACPAANGGPCNCESLAGQSSNLRAFMGSAVSRGTAPSPMRGMWPAQPSVGGDQSAFYSPSLGSLRDVSLPGQHRSNESLMHPAASSTAAPFSAFEPGFGLRSATSSPMSNNVGSSDTRGAFLIPQLPVITP